VHRIPRLAVALPLAIAATSCSSGASNPPKPSSITINLKFSTTSGLVGTNKDDVKCAWSNPSFTLRDGNGSIIATGPAKSSLGAGTLGDEAVELGSISRDPSYKCEMPFAIDAKSADFYQLDASTQEPKLADYNMDPHTTFKAQKTFSRTDAQRGAIDIEFTG
jgi:hypothetical protein